MKHSKLYALVLMVGMTNFVQVANAGPIILPACALGDVTFEGNDADACAGANAGNIAGPDDAGIIDGYFGSAWSYLTASDAGGVVGTFNGIQFTLSGVGAGSSGSWTLGWVDANGAAPANLPFWIDLAAVVKAGNGHAAYLFDDLMLAAAPDNSGQGTWEVIIANQNEIPLDLSHLGLYVRIGTCTSNCDPLPPGGGGNPIPEPETLALLGIGLLGMGASLKRKTQYQ